MKWLFQEPRRDPELGDALRRLERPSRRDDSDLRQRIVAAATPQSLHYLDEISRRTAVDIAQVPRRGVERAMPVHRHSARSASGLPLAARAGVR